MRAITVTEFGGPEVLHVSELAEPQPGAGEVRVRVVARPVNPIDVMLRTGALAGAVPASDHYVPGLDFAGVVDAVGPGVTAPAVGRRVVGISPWFLTQAGSYAEQVVVPADVLAQVPEDLDLVAASTLPLNGVTAAMALDAAGVAANSSVLVTGASGGVGGFAVQLAAARGARVLAVAGAEDVDLVRSLGAADVVARGAHVVADVRRLLPGGVDAVVDAASLVPVAAVRDGGSFAALVAPAAPAAERDITVTVVQHVPDGALLSRLVDEVHAGRLSLRVAATYPLSEAALAHEHVAKGGVRGRVVLTS
ncbi:MAG: NADP-dependent oxidoreductase [Motilibacteraceae bacterium]